MIFCYTMKLCLFVSLIIYTDFIYTVLGTGVLYDPPSRAVMWKYRFPVERNYNYMQLHCGGILVSLYLVLKSSNAKIFHRRSAHCTNTHVRCMRKKYIDNKTALK